MEVRLEDVEFGTEEEENVVADEDHTQHAGTSTADVESTQADRGSPAEMTPRIDSS